MSARPDERLRPEPIRPVPLRGTWGYLSQLGVAPGETLDVHVSAEAAYELDIVKLGTTAILAGNDVAADREDVEILARWTHDRATPQELTPGSYVLVDGPPIPPGDLTLGVWVRPWVITQVDVAQWQWQAVLADIDYPGAARFGILIDEWGRVNAYAGDGGPLRQSFRHWSSVSLADRLGEWVALVVTITTAGVRIYVDGECVGRSDDPVPTAVVSAASRLRLGADMETGRIGNFFEGDLADPFVLAGGVDDDFARRHHQAEGLPAFHDSHRDRLLAWWPLDEERGDVVRDASGNGRTGRIVNHATWRIGGPSLGPESVTAIQRSFLTGAAPYHPDRDPRHGHGLRLASDDIVDFGWAAAASWEVPADARSGLYAARVRLAGQEPQDALAIPFVVVRREPASEGAIALVCSTNTWLAYGRRPANEEALSGMTASFYSVHVTGRPHFYVGARGPLPMISPYRFDSRRAAHNHHGHLVRPERLAEAWLTAEGYPFECLTDADVHARPEVLRRFTTVMLVGHDEYWSYEMQESLRDYLADGGTVVSLSGDTMSQRVAFDDTLSVLEARKVHVADARWLTPDQWGERWLAYDGKPGGTLRSLGSPSYRLIGVSTQGMTDDGVAENFAPFTVLEPDHWLFQTPTPVPMIDGQIGRQCLNGPRASGYEYDSDPAMKDLVPEPQPGSVTLAAALGQESLGTIGPSDRGGDIVYWERPDGGRVLAVGSIAATGALPVDDGVSTLVRNALAAFGVTPRATHPDPSAPRTGGAPCPAPGTT